MAITEISVNAAGVVTGDALRWIADLLAAASAAHTPRVLVRALAASLSSRLPIRRVELRSLSPIAVAERADGAWRCVAASPDVSATVIADGLAVVPTGPLPVFCTSPEFRAVIEQVVETATRHMAVVQRVADLSRRAHVETRALRADLERRQDREVIARSAAMREVLARAHLVAGHTTTVLITGESGSGKEVVAKEIHRRSPRGHRALLQLNCGAIPAGLVESELFGHERGAFTGADRARAGLFERADRGTVLLDEIGDLPPAAQVKLLRVLQDRQVRRVGGTAAIDVDVRLIAATNRPLAAMVRTGAFREDLYYRLDVFAIRVPALRERRDDLAPLVNTLIAQLSERLGIPAPAVTRAALRKLEAHDWPGNVRELMNVLETALIVGRGRTLELPDQLCCPALGPEPPIEPGFAAAARRAIEDALRTSRGRIYGAGGAAARLGLKPATLQSKMKKLGVRRADFC